MQNQVFRKFVVRHLYLTLLKKGEQMATKKKTAKKSVTKKSTKKSK